MKSWNSSNTSAAENWCSTGTSLTAGRCGGGGAGVGALLFGIIGHAVENKLRTQDAYEYVVKLTNGQILTVCQGLDAVFDIGRRVIVIVSHEGRSRIIPDDSSTFDIQAPVYAPNVTINKNR